MKITKELVDILRNYVVINSSILFKEGNIVSTISPLKNIISMTTISTRIEREFAIYDLAEFLGIISLLDNAVAEFSDSQIIIKSSGKTIKYTYANPSAIVCSPYRGIEIADDEIITSFKLSFSEFNNLSKASGILRTKDIVISGSSGLIDICVGDVKNKTGSSYSTSITPIKEFDMDFRKVFDMENFRVMNGDYIITIPNKNLIEFKTEDGNLTYWIAPSSNT
ncbi:MAG: hypothetical protein NTZ20_04925 [Candidatus Levybacteria bacterium]|nr:hypothetical protein [Candidatus Levybacteria bacterium]